MKKYGRDNRPYVKPVTRIELSEKNTKLRIILIVVLLSIGAVALMTGLFQLINVEPGWQQVEVSSQKPNCSGSFVLMYDFSDYGASATSASRELNRVYTGAAEKAYVLFSPDTEDAAVQNLWYVNQHVNETISVDPALYRAFSQVQAAGNRSIYLAPVYDEYNRIFLCENEEEARWYDPAHNEELRPYLHELAAFANDPQAIDVALLGDNRVQLTVSEDYLAFAEEYAIDTFLDFSWLKNAFIADYLAEVLSAEGFTRGYLSSHDGFTRNLDDRGISYSFNIFDRQENLINMPARMQYTSPMSIVFLRNYPMTEQDRWHYYSYASGHITTVHIDAADGRSKSAIDSLTGYSADKGCAEILLELMPVYIAEEFDPEALLALAGEATYAVWCEGDQLRSTDSGLHLELLDNAYSIQ